MVRACWVVAALAGCAFNPAPPIATDGPPLVDAAGDAPIDAAPQPPSFTASAVTSQEDAALVTLPVTIPDGAGRFLIVAVQLGAGCNDMIPSVVSVLYDSVALAQLATISGTPCGAGSRSDQWHLVAPATGTHNVVVALSGNADSVHVGALAFAGVNQVTPVRGTATASGAGESSSVVIASSVDDLVVNTVGDGNSVSGPGTGQTQRYLRNVDSSNTLNNSAASTAPGASSVAMAWKFGANDEFQTISTSLRP